MKKALSMKAKSKVETRTAGSYGQLEASMRAWEPIVGEGGFADSQKIEGPTMPADGEASLTGPVLAGLNEYRDFSSQDLFSYQEMLNNLPLFAAIALTNGVITFVNDYAIKASGSSREYLIGKVLWNGHWWSRQAKELEMVQKAFEKSLTGTTVRLDIPYEAVDSSESEHWMDLILKPLPEGTDRSQIKRILISGMDISDRKKQEAEQRNALKESEIHFRSLAETLPQIIWTANPVGEINYTNSQWKDYSNSIYPTDWISFAHPEDKEKGRQAWDESIKNGSPLEVDVRLKSKSGSYRWFLLRAVTTRDKHDKIIGWCGSATDIEDRKIQAKELSDAKSEAERANATKSAFLANMSHEIRTPLGAILGFTELLRDPNTGPEERLGYLDIICRNGKALTRVIDDILDLSKVEAGHLEIEQMPFSLPDLLSEITSLFSETVKAKRLYLTLAIDSNVPNQVLSDPARLRQILINIIGNAVKFTSLGGIKVKVEAAHLKSGKSKITISVSDTGPGLMRSQQKKLFQPFTQADNTTTRKYGGTGLGLALSRRLAQAMGGNIAISECKLRRGCTFQITIEVAHPEVDVKHAERADDLQTETGVLVKARVLLVEDALDNQILIKRILTKNGAKVDIANNGCEGVEKAMSGDYSIVLMDIQMPIMDGYEAIQKLRSLGYKGMVYALTAHAMAEERKKTQVAGYDGHLTKPLDTEVLVKTVRLHIKDENSELRL